MSRLLVFASAFALSSAGLAHADSACPKLTPGAFYPWQTSRVFPDDQHATIYVDVDAKGRAGNCRMGKNNLAGREMGFFLCRALIETGELTPEMKDGVPVASTITREFLIPGRTHVKEDAAARKKYFAEHPDEKPRCYP